MKILITGGTGFIGKPLCSALVAEGHRLIVLSRQTLADTAHIRFVSCLDKIQSNESIQAIINLAGASLADKRWDARYKQEIISSRIDTTESILQLIQRLDIKPMTLISGSAIGYYGHHGDEALNESSKCTPGFAHSLCRQWEDLALTAEQWNVRVSLLRIGVVFDREGGAFEQMARPFSFGIANWLGDGAQWVSWVHRVDVISAIQFLLEHNELKGAFNITAPQPVTSRGFSDAMAKHKRVFLSVPVPAVVMRLLIGEMADELLLNGQKVMPNALTAAGFEFRFPDLDSALRYIVSTN